MKPVCVTCQRFFRPKKNGTSFVEGKPAPGVVNAVPGTARPEDWKPYKLWLGDRWACDGCGAQIIVGVGFQPVCEHYKPDFADAVASFRPALQVNDC